MPTAKVNGIDIYYEIHGSGEPLLMITGTVDITAWAAQIPDFSKRYKVIAFDNRGIGRTGAPEGPYSIGQMTEDTAGLMDAVGLEKARVLGFSMGGWIAIELALKYPERVKGLVLAGTSRCCSPLVAERTRVMVDLLGALSPELFFRNFALWFFGDAFFSKKENVEGFVKGALDSPYPMQPHAVRELGRAITGYKGSERLGEIKAPTLVVAGEDDIAQPPRLSRELASSIPGSRLATIERCGHMFILEDPQAFNKSVLEFLDSL